MVEDIIHELEDDSLSLEKKEKEMKLEELSSFSLGNNKEEISENLNFLVATASGQKNKNVKKFALKKLNLG